MKRHPFPILALVGLTLGISGCSDDGEGDVTVNVYGEDFIEQGIPAEEMSDDWSVSFDRFVVTIDEVMVGGVEMPPADPVDISVPTDGSGHPIANAIVPTGTHSEPSFAIARVDLSGSATRAGVTKTFDWVFDQEIHYSACETTTEVSDGGSATFQITVHADHFFYDSLVAEEPELAFEALANADTDNDGDIARAELEAADIGSYDPGSDGAVDNLWAWLVAQNRTLGHVDGEGHCDSHAHSD